MTWAASGKKCICVVDTFFAVLTDTYPEVKRGDVLVIRDLFIDPLTPDGRLVPGVFMNFEGRNPDAVYNIAGFRPIVEKDEAEDVAAFLYVANHIDPIVRADEYERSFAEVEAALSRFDLP